LLYHVKCFGKLIAIGSYRFAKTHSYLLITLAAEGCQSCLKLNPFPMTQMWLPFIESKLGDYVYTHPPCY
jgi:hypothetical protein